MSTDPRSLRMADYTYDLPDERIARYPLAQRDASRLLVFRDNVIEEDIFRNIPSFLPDNALLVLNTAKVVRARMRFQKPSGGIIEIFCLEPHPSYADIATAMSSRSEVRWQCLVGGAAKWKPGTILSLHAAALTVYAALEARNSTDFTIRFSWTPQDLSWAEVMEAAGQVPLPPYLNREAEQEDTDSYQTLFAQHEGSVAAPTASLHFTPEVLQQIADKGIQTANVTLHVGAGTFKPVKSETAGGHEMHGEWIEIGPRAIEALIRAQGPVVAAGTTALRTLESLYWMGCKTLNDPGIEPVALALKQWEAYNAPALYTRQEALDGLLQWMSQQELSRLVTRTGIMIAPGYKFRIADVLITNFHQPGSTLLLLVSAFIGDNWKRVYDYALAREFRFLSYGDASLLWRLDR